MMTRSLMTCLSMVVGLLLMSAWGCATKSGQSGAGSKASVDALDKTPGATDGMGSEGGGLRGFDPLTEGRSLSEERLGSGGMLAKAEPSDITQRQLEQMRREQAATLAAGVRDVFFTYDSWTIVEEGRQVLNRDAEWIKGNRGAHIRIEGHCDERGTLAYNLVLGEKRAKAVRNYLVELGVNHNQLSVVSYGKERPFCKGSAEPCFAQNRRGHIVVRTK